MHLLGFEPRDLLMAFSDTSQALYQLSYRCWFVDDPPQISLLKMNQWATTDTTTIRSHGLCNDIFKYSLEYCTIMCATNLDGMDLWI